MGWGGGTIIKRLGLRVYHGLVLRIVSNHLVPLFPSTFSPSLSMV